VLVSLVPDEFLQRKEQAAAELDQVSSRLGIPAGTEGADIEKTSLVRKSLAEFDNARKDLERRKDLAGKNLIAMKDVDDADARFLVAEANVRARARKRTTSSPPCGQEGGPGHRGERSFATRE